QLQPALAAGHPWVYRDNLPKHQLSEPQIVRVTAGSATAYGIYSHTGAIGVRLYGSEVPDRELIIERISEALALRALAFGAVVTRRRQADSDAYRLVNGEGDRLPGLVIDRYGRYAVIKRYAQGLD